MIPPEWIFMVMAAPTLKWHNKLLLKAKCACKRAGRVFIVQLLLCLYEKTLLWLIKPDVTKLTFAFASGVFLLLSLAFSFINSRQ